MAMITTDERSAFRYFADILDYPQAGLPETLRACEALVPPEARLLLAEFRGFTLTMPLGRLQELYAETFDWDTTFPLHLGYYLLGENYKRSVFLTELKARYRAQGFDMTGVTELPDHLPLILRFLSVCHDEDLSAELITEAISPALDKMFGGKGAEGQERAGHPYAGVFQALQQVLQGQARRGTACRAPTLETAFQQGGNRA